MKKLPVGGKFEKSARDMSRKIRERKNGRIFDFFQKLKKKSGQAFLSVKQSVQNFTLFKTTFLPSPVTSMFF